MFADDTSLSCANGDLKKLETEINEELFKVRSWLVVNKLTLNIEKTNYIIFRPRQKTIPFHPNIKIINNNSNTSQPLEMKNYIIYLGILIDSNLSWKFHIDLVCQEVSKTINYRQAQTFCSPSCTSHFMLFNFVLHQLWYLCLGSCC